MKPSIGRAVHYSPAEGICWAATVTAVELGPCLHHESGEELVGDLVVLAIQPPMQDVFHRSVVEGHAPGTWHWPERVND